MPIRDTSDAGGFVFLDSAYIYAPTAGAPVLTLVTTDDDATTPYIDLVNSGTPMPYIMEKDGTRFLHTYGTSNLFCGAGAGNFTLTGTVNSGFGANVLSSVTSGHHNSGLGGDSLRSLTTAWYNLAVGSLALNSLISGSYNIALGADALGQSVTGFYNVAIAGSAMYRSNGSKNIGIGVSAMSYNQTGSNNVAIGTEVAVGAAIGNANFSNTVIIGYQAGRNLPTTGSGCVFIGYQAGFNEAIGNRLYIANSNADQPLIWGDFTNRILRIWEHLEVKQSINIVCNNDTVVCHSDSVVVN